MAAGFNGGEKHGRDKSVGPGRISEGNKRGHVDDTELLKELRISGSTRQLHSRRHEVAGQAMQEKAQTKTKTRR